jgi:hypothetical protein
LLFIIVQVCGEAVIIEKLKNPRVILQRGLRFLYLRYNLGVSLSSS